MNRLIVILMLLFTSNLLANECKKKYVAEVKSILVNGSLGTTDKTGKLEKFTHHDYSISCDITIKNRKFKWFTDEYDTRFLLQEIVHDKVVYYGLFKSPP